MRAHPQRVLYIQRPGGGGSAVSLRNLLHRLDRERFEPLVLVHQSSRACDDFRTAGAHVLLLDAEPEGTPGRRDRPAPDGPFRSTRAFLRRELPIARRVARIIRSEGIDLVHHNNNVRANRSSVLGALIAGVPQVCHARSLRIGTAVDRRLARVVARFIYVSREVERRYREMGVQRTRGETIYDPVDFDAFDGQADLTALRGELGLDPGDRVVTNVGRLVRWKGQDDFLRAMARVLTRHPESKALIVGEANPTDESRRFERDIRDLAAALGITERVVFAGFRDDIPAIVAISEVLVHSSAEPEPLGLVVLEAMAGGRPIVATAAGGVPELVEDGATGLLVPLRSPEKMADAISDLLTRPDRADRIGRRARESVRDRFDMNRHARSIESVYSRILASGE